MIYNDKNITNNTDWKRINMRNVSHLMGVEFIHDLYNRYNHKINAVRFRHTVTIWKDGIVNSYAPKSEWERLEKILGHQFYRLSPNLIKNTKDLYSFKRKYFFNFIKKLEKTDLSSLENSELASGLIEFQSVVLGELYKLNFVQIEHSLNFAVKKIINEIILDKTQADDLFIKIIQTEKSTQSQKEKLDLCFLSKKWKFLDRIGFFNENKVRLSVKKHYLKYKYLYSAYGESPRDFESFWIDFINYFKGKNKSSQNFLFKRLLSTEARSILKKLKNDKLDILVPLLVYGGLFRDKNKALLGQSIKYRFDILNEIVRRNLENLDNLNYYLLSEIVELLNNSYKLEKNEIENRKNNGVVFTRFEDFDLYEKDKFNFLDNLNTSNILKGHCASQGICIGKCKIVLNKLDAEKVKEGDILVAIGTDFDLIEAMYRSSAVITEEGGILCHAAVVCRELKKPCCIGVKNATKILEDGQLIELNANFGNIVILN